MIGEKMNKVLGSMKKERMDSFSPDATITFMRHGKPCYTKEELETCDFEGKLTEEGRVQVEKSAQKIAEEMKERGEQVAIVWSSARNRADETSQIVVKTLEENEIQVLDRAKDNRNKHKKITSLSAPDMTPEFWSQKPKDEFFVRIWKELYEKGELPEGVESPDKSEDKLKRVIEFNSRMIDILKKKREGDQGFPKFRIINVGHFETATPILQEAYGGRAGIDKEFGPEDAGFLNMEMQTTENGSIMKMSYERGAQGGSGGDVDAYLNFDKKRNISKIS